ncbi:MAG: hypothetical protein K6T87_20285, partial [Roseiflexus sp.]|uniref:hypothetical protein n=1 Tax=Roseiflexus sp. TaxID=2562120 RepID=UPI0025E660FC
AAPLGHALRDEIRDRLALASSRWPLYDTVLPFADKHDSAVLRGVRIEHQVVVGRGALIERLNTYRDKRNNLSRE